MLQEMKARPTDVAALLAAAIAGRGSKRAAAEAAGRIGSPFAIKALQASTFSAGGVLIRDDIAQEIITALRPSSVFRTAGERGPHVVNLAHGNLTLSVQTGSSGAEFVAEGQAVEVTAGPSHGFVTRQVVMLRRVAALTAVSNDLTRYTAAKSLSFAAEDLLLAVGQREDQAYLRDDGSVSTPRGLKYQMPVENVLLNDAASLSGSDLAAELGRLWQRLMETDVPMVDCCWFMAPRTFVFLRDLYKPNGRKFFPTLSENAPRLEGWPVQWTNAIPIDLGGGDESEIYFVDMNEVVIYQWPEVLIDFSNSALYVAGGEPVCAFARDETLVSVRYAVDMRLRHPQAAAMLTEVDWA